MGSCSTAKCSLIHSRMWHTAVSELLGTFLLVSLGLSAAATAAVSAPATAQLGSGLALIVALYVSMGASGGHINPAVSTALFVVKRMPLADFLVYQAAQYTGGLLAAALVCCFFYPPLLDFAGADPAASGDAANISSIVAANSATADMENIYVTHAHQSVSVWRALTSEVFATGSFILAVRGITDSRNAGPPMHLQPPMIAAVVLALTQCTAPLSGCALNPARDLPSRVVVAVFQLVADGATTGLFSLGGNSGFVAPLLGPYLGATIGSWLYELCIARGLPAASNSLADDVEEDENYDDEFSDETRNKSEDPFNAADAVEKGPRRTHRQQRKPRRRMMTRDTDLSLLSSGGKSRDVSVSLYNA